VLSVTFHSNPVEHSVTNLFGLVSFSVGDVIDFLFLPGCCDTLEDVLIVLAQKLTELTVLAQVSHDAKFKLKNKKHLLLQTAHNESERYKMYVPARLKTTNKDDIS
jgi:hypothetical protein